MKKAKRGIFSLKLLKREINAQNIQILYSERVYRQQRTWFLYCVVSHSISEHDDHEFGGHGHHGGDHGFGHGFGDDMHDHDHDPFGGHGMGNGHGHHGGHHDRWDKHGSKHKGTTNLLLRFEFQSVTSWFSALEIMKFQSILLLKFSVVS